MAKKTAVRIVQQVELRKPLRDPEGYLTYSDALVYMARTTIQDHPDFRILWNLASYALCNSLSYKQRMLADSLISKYEEQNPCVFTDETTAGEML